MTSSSNSLSSAASAQLPAQNFKSDIHAQWPIEGGYSTSINPPEAGNYQNFLFIHGSSRVQAGLRSAGIRSCSLAASRSSGHSIAIVSRPFNATRGIHGTGIGTGGSRNLASISTVPKIHLRKGSIAVSLQQ
jgi:hypothetical protein